MAIIDAREYVDTIALADTLSRYGVVNPMAASSFIAEEVCRFYVSDLEQLRGDNFIILPKPRRRHAFYNAHKHGLLQTKAPWQRIAYCLDDNFFNLDELGAALRHMDYLYRPMVVSSVNAPHHGILFAELRG